MGDGGMGDEMSLVHLRINTWDIKSLEQKGECIAFRHPPPNSARFSYATERVLFYLRTAVQRRGQRPPKDSGANMTA